MSSIARVEPLTTARALRGPFDYRIPREMEGVGVGSVLLVPFGRRRILGLVVDVGEHTDVPWEKLVEPVAPLEAGVPPDLVELGLWVAEAYCSTPARGLALVLPPGTGTAAHATAGRLHARAAGGHADAGGPRGAGRLRPHPPRPAAARCAQPARARALDRRRAGRRPRHAREPRAPRPRDDRQAAGRAPPGEHRAGRRQPRRRRGAARVDARAGVGAGAVLDPLRERRHASLLLHGVTGSGKTEVYLRAADAALAQGRSAIVMVPEIALTPQTARRFEERFGERVAILHSKLGLGERYDEWRRLRDGQARICVGPRSAVFAPLADLGLIVVDEEHDSAYKQEGDPRYDAREVAERRARGSGAVLVCGSATPRAESWHRMHTLSLPARVDNLALPPVELVDMRGLRHALHPDVAPRARGRAQRGRKAIVLVNRRGWSAFVECRDCGRTWMCPHCDVTLTLHREGTPARLACHHCGHFEPAPHSCPDCGSTAVSRHGAGRSVWRPSCARRSRRCPSSGSTPTPRAASTASRRRWPPSTAADAGVLVGTQMVAQGHDFPEVELAVVQDADATLRFPDFRSEERTFALVSQLAGRSGRGPAGGRVLVQT